MKRTNGYLIWLSMLLLLLSAQIVQADSIWTPMDDYFEKEVFDPENESACEYNPKDYTAFTESGSVRAVASPLDDTLVKEYSNGTEFHIPWLCKTSDGKTYGAVQAARLPDEQTFADDWTGKSGYILTDDLLPNYSYDDFNQEHQSEFQAYNGEFDIKNSTGFVVWSYPGSGVIVEDADQETITYLVENPDWGLFSLINIWTDPAGNKWAAIEIERPRVNGWINLADPSSKEPLLISDGFEWADGLSASFAIPQEAQTIREVNAVYGQWQGIMIYTIQGHSMSVSIQTLIEAYDPARHTDLKSKSSSGSVVTCTFGNLIFDGERLIPRNKGKSSSYAAVFDEGSLKVDDGNHDQFVFWEQDGIQYARSSIETPDNHSFSRLTTALMRTAEGE